MLKRKLKYFRKLIISSSKALSRFLVAIFYNTICKCFIFIFAKRNIDRKKYYVSICLIFKDEANFLKEWISYHLEIGVDHFYLYNNNSTDDYKAIITPYIDNGVVTLIDWPFQQAQIAAYKHCFENYRNESNWISFLDADEFVCLIKHDNIAKWLKKYVRFPSVTIYWKMFGTGGLLKHDRNKLVIEQYTVCWDHLNVHGKCFVNTYYDIANYDKWFMHHSTYMLFSVGGISVTLPPVNQFKYFCTIDTMWGHGDKNNNSEIQINHYFTKAWDIYELKSKKSDVFFTSNPKLDFSYFLKYEMKCTSVDYSIFRFVMKLKLKNEMVFDSENL